MGTFDEFNKKEKPVFTGSRFGFGAGAAAPSGPGLPAIASGGTKYTYNSKTIHVFTSGTEPFICPKNITAEVFVVGGGGGGATDMAGGGGAGGVRNLSSSITEGIHVVTVGAGGDGTGQNSATNSGTAPRQGGNSSIGSIVVATGGGYGGWESGGSGPGGSGGGAHGRSPGQASSVASPDGISPTTQGNAGGQISGTFAGGAGGGGWGDAGSTSRGGNGAQCPTTFRDPSNSYGAPGPGAPNFYFAAGGGAGRYQSGGIPGGYGGGGNGGDANAPGADTATNGTTNTGSGGGGGGSHNNGPAGNGGPGIVFIAYPDSTFP